MLKPSVKTGEFWLYIGAGLLMMYLDSHGITIDELAKHGEIFVTKIEANVEYLKYVLLPSLFAVQRTVLKWKELDVIAKKDTE